MGCRRLRANEDCFHDEQLETPPSICHIKHMTASVLEQELKTLPEVERAQIIRAALRELSPTALKALERQLRRLAHPEVPEDVWTGFEEAEEGRGIEIRDEHFDQPPV
jgi:hypothetical protein